MKVDSLGLLVSEMHDDITANGFNGNRGDSCANTARWRHLLKLLYPSDVRYEPLLEFITNNGYVRHPKNMIWRENDMPSDQLMPLYIAFKVLGMEAEREQMFHRLSLSGWTTDNGDLVAPAFYAILIESRWKLNIALLGQALIFKLPWRWSDEKKRFERSAGSTADYLNYFHASQFASPWVRRLVDKKTILDKISSYYSNEPDGKWLVDLYREALK